MEGEEIQWRNGRVRKEESYKEERAREMGQGRIREERRMTGTAIVDKEGEAGR